MERVFEVTVTPDRSPMEVKDFLAPYNQSWIRVGPDMTWAELDGFRAVCRLLILYTSVYYT